MSGLLQRLVGQARGAGAGGSQIRPAMSVHAQVPLGGAAAEGPELTALDPGLQPTDRAPDTIYKSEPEPPAREVPVSSDGPPAPQSVEPASSPRMSTPTQRSRGFKHLNAERGVVGREAPVPQPLFSEVRTSAVLPMINSPMAGARRGNESHIRHEAYRDTTEVHVHIGRIDVIGTPEPAPPKKMQRPSARPTIPLAQYLSKKARP